MSFPFAEEPPSCYLKNNASVGLNDSEFVVQTITALLEANCGSECVDVPYCCNPLMVVVGKKKRLVIDLSRSVILMLNTINLRTKILLRYLKCLKQVIGFLLLT